MCCGLKPVIVTASNGVVLSSNRKKYLVLIKMQINMNNKKNPVVKYFIN